jgi:hypothetical protein
MRQVLNRRLLAGMFLVLFSASAVGSEGPPTVSAPSAKPSADSTKFLRVRRDEDQQPTALETAVTRYVTRDEGSEGVTVDLVGAVHVGERDYYDQLNRLFRSYDAVLYELVAPEGTRVVPGQKQSRAHPVSFLQHMMKNVLKLEFQLDRIDYSPPNLVHADMSAEEFTQSMKDRGESFLKLFWRILSQSMATPAKPGSRTTDAELLVALVAQDRAYRLKRILAEQFEDMEQQLAVLEGPDGSTIITERNKRALEVLRRQMEAGKRRVAIFYGAGHLPDMARRLESEFAMSREGQRWLVAWTIEREAAPAAPLPAAPAEPEPADAAP